MEAIMTWLLTMILQSKNEKASKKANYIRRIVSNTLMLSSVLVSVCSYIGLRKTWIRNKAIVKIVMYVSGFIAIALMLVNGLHFVPEPPIR